MGFQEHQDRRVHPRLLPRVEEEGSEPDSLTLLAGDTRPHHSNVSVELRRRSFGNNGVYVWPYITENIMDVKSKNVMRSTKLSATVRNII